MVALLSNCTLMSRGEGEVALQIALRPSVIYDFIWDL